MNNKVESVTRHNLPTMQTERISISLIDSNDGQIDGLPKNPRFIKDEAFRALCNSVKEYPEMLEMRECLVYPHDGRFVVIGGNMRLRACRELKYTDVPCKVLPVETPVDKLKAYIIKDNAKASGEWDMDDLANSWELSELKEWGADLPLWDVVEEPATEEDNYTGEPPAEPVTVLGDLYELNGHRVLCGDSTDSDAVARLMNGEKADMVFTDPPYGYQYQSNYQDKHEMLLNDDKLLDFLPIVYMFMADNSAIYVCASHQTVHLWRPLIEDNFSYKNLIVWKKNNWSMGDLTGSFAGQHELIFFAHKGRVELRGERSRDVWEFDRDPPKDHPTQKPVALVAFAIEKVTNRNFLLLDPFLGSGTTLIAGEQLGRTVFGQELSPAYIDVIILRWVAYMTTNNRPYTVKRNGEDITSEAWLTS